MPAPQLDGCHQLARARACRPVRGQAPVPPPARQAGLAPPAGRCQPACRRACGQVYGCGCGAWGRRRAYVWGVCVGRMCGAYVWGVACVVLWLASIECAACAGNEGHLYRLAHALDLSSLPRCKHSLSLYPFTFYPFTLLPFSVCPVPIAFSPFRCQPSASIFPG
eukprot:364890-Chlamydomonas_euryale.AAC.7